MPPSLVVGQPGRGPEGRGAGVADERLGPGVGVQVGLELKPPLEPSRAIWKGHLGFCSTVVLAFH